MNEIKPMKPPAAGLTDKALAIGKAILSDIVPLGGTFAELAGQFIHTPYQKRIEEWQEQVGEALDRLASNTGVRLEDLQSDPKFVDTVLHASQVALRNANAEKRTALRNAILNSGLPSAPDEAQRQMFLNMVDAFTPWHLRILALFDNPMTWFKRAGRQPPSFSFSSSLQQLLEIAFPELRDQRDFYDQVWKDLNDRGVVNTPGLRTMMSATGAFEERTTPFGRAFMAFISEP